MLPKATLKLLWGKVSHLKTEKRQLWLDEQTVWLATYILPLPVPLIAVCDSLHQF